MPQAPLGTPIHMFFWAGAFVEVSPGHFTPGSNFTVTANFANTTVLEAIDLYDADDQLITDWLMTDTVTGTPLFDATGRLVPVAPPAVIPEPGTWMLMAGGVVLLGWLHARRRRDLARVQA